MTSLTHAEVIATPYVNTNCASITTLLRYGKNDVTTNGQVTILQDFLHRKGYLSVSSTGYFGVLTQAAVKAFQRDSASGAVDGIVGVQTQAHIRALDCVATIPTTAPTISSITPSTGPSGSIVTITGSGFTPTNNIIHFAIGGISVLSTTGTTLTFTVPSTIGPYCKAQQVCPLYLALLNAGTYPVYVENANGSSNTVSFTITNNATVIPQ